MGVDVNDDVATRPGLEWIECPVCETIEHTVTLAALEDGEAIAECRRCGLQYLNPHLDQTGLDAYYQPKEISVETVWGAPFAAQRFHREAYERSGTCKDLRRRVELVKRFVPRGRLLDVGCSIGLMLYEAEREGFQATGFDISRKMIEYARNVFHVDARLGGFEELADDLGRFDAAVIWDVLEHLPYPGQTMSLIASHLEVGGCVFGHIPNSDGLANRLKTWANLKGLRRKKWSHFGVPMHIMWFNPKNLTMMLERIGYRVEEVGAWSHLRKRAAPGLVNRALNYPLERALRTSYFWFVARKVEEPPPHRLTKPRRWSAAPPAR